MIFRRTSSICGFVAAMMVGVTGTLRAQSVAGTVRSSAGALAGVTVRLLELQRIVRTGSSGRFTFTECSEGHVSHVRGRAGIRVR